MGQRLTKKKSSKNQKKAARAQKEKQPVSVNPVSIRQSEQTTVSTVNPIVSSKPKNDFFGFSPSCFFQDFKRTFISTIIVLVILLIIFFMVK